MPNAKASDQAKTQTFEFQLAPGDEKIVLPHGFSRPDAVWLVDIRRRRVYLEQLSVDDFTVLGQRYTMSTGEAVPHLRGMPRYFTIRAGVMWLWPVPAHAWPGAMNKGGGE